MYGTSGRQFAFRTAGVNFGAARWLWRLLTRNWYLKVLIGGIIRTVSLVVTIFVSGKFKSDGNPAILGRIQSRWTEGVGGRAQRIVRFFLLVTAPSFHLDPDRRLARFLPTENCVAFHLNVFKQTLQLTKARVPPSSWNKTFDTVERNGTTKICIFLSHPSTPTHSPFPAPTQAAHQAFGRILYVYNSENTSTPGKCSLIAHRLFSARYTNG